MPLLRPDTDSITSRTSSGPERQESITSRSSSPERQIQGQFAQAVRAATDAIFQTIEEEHKNLLEFASMLDEQIEAYSRKPGGSQVAALGATILASIQDHFTKQHNKKGLMAGSTPRTYAAAAQTAVPPKPRAAPMKPNPKRVPPLRLFLRLSKDHPARQASPYAVLQLLRAQLDPIYVPVYPGSTTCPHGPSDQPKGYPQQPTPPEQEGRHPEHNQRLPR